MIKLVATRPMTTCRQCVHLKSTVVEPGGNGLVIPVTIRVTISPIFTKLTILFLQQLLQEKTKSATDGVEMKWSEGCQEE
jgi:hypothetical protein